MTVRTTLKRLALMSAQPLRNAYYRDSALPILLADQVLKASLRKGGEGSGEPPGQRH